MVSTSDNYNNAAFGANCASNEGPICVRRRCGCVDSNASAQKRMCGCAHDDQRRAAGVGCQFVEVVYIEALDGAVVWTAKEVPGGVVGVTDLLVGTELMGGSPVSRRLGLTHHPLCNKLNRFPWIRCQA
jgi:hypothetical protein